MTRIATVLLILAGLGGAPLTREPAAAPPPQCEAPASAQPFIPALADSGRIYRGALRADGREFWYFRKVSDDPRQEDYRIYVTTRAASGWSEPRRVDLGGEFSDLYPAISADGRRLVFASYRRAPGDTSATPNASLWYAERNGDGWGPARYIAPASEPGHYHSQVTVAANEDIYFRRTTPDWSRTVELLAPVAGDGYGAARPVDDAARFTGSVPGHYVWGARPGHDGSYMLLEVSATDSAGRRGPADLWFSSGNGAGLWTEPQPLGAGVNTAGAETFPAVSADGCRLIFTRDFSGFHHVSLAAAMAVPRD